MKNIIKTGLFFLFLTFLQACAIHDPVDDWASIGQRLPHSYWELSSNAVKAGESLNFRGQYYPYDDNQIDFTAVWYSINELITYEATCPLVTFTYNLSISVDTLVREDQEIIRYAHKEEYWNEERSAYVLDQTFPVSNTLGLVEWKEVEDFDQSRYDALYPDTFENVFKRDLFDKLMDSDYLKDLRKIFVDLEIMTVEEFTLLTDSVYNENSDAHDKFLKEEVKQEVENTFYDIPLSELLYNSSESMYMINYTKEYNLNATFRVYDKKGNAGKSEMKLIEVN